MIELHLSREVESGNALAYRHWRTRMRDRDAWIILVRLAVRGRDLTPPAGKRAVHILAYRKRRLDSDNLSAGCKHLRDALVRCGLLIDDNDKHSAFTYELRLASEHPSRLACTLIRIQDLP